MRITSEAWFSGYCLGGAFCVAREWDTMTIALPWKIGLIGGLLLVSFLSRRTARRLESELRRRAED